jgi:hypothetical protein
MPLFTRIGAVWALACLFASSLHAQSLKWISHDPVPSSAGDRSYIARRNQTTTFQEPGFEPLAVIPREDGAYVVVPVNGGSTSNQLASMLNPSWQRQRGFQILRLDAQGQVLWQRMWTRRASYNGFVSPDQMGLSDARLTPDGGLALLSGTALYLDASGGNARHFSPHSPPTGCMPEGFAFSQSTSFFAADASMVVIYRRWRTSDFSPGNPRACAFALDGSLLDAIETEPELELDVVDFRAGVGFLTDTYVFNQGIYSQRSTRLRTGAQTRWSREHAIESSPQLAIAPNGSTWLREGSELQVIGSAGQTLAQVAVSDYTAPAAWLPGGDVLLANTSTLELHRVSALGSERWSRPADPSGGGDFARWHVLGDRVRAVSHASYTSPTRVRLPSFDLANGDLLSSQEFPAYELAAGPIGTDNHVRVKAAPHDNSWYRDQSTCSAVCDPHAVGVSSGLDLRVFDSGSGALQATLDPYGFPYTTYARLRERHPGVVWEFGNASIVHARYVSDGAKELLEISRPDQGGVERWRTRLEFERFDVQNAALTLVNDETYVAASAIGAVAQEHRLWKLDAAGAVVWTRTLAEPLQQLMRLRLNNVPVACGMGQAQRPSTPVAAPVWQCFAANGERVVDTRLWHVLAFAGWDVADAIPNGTVSIVRDIPPASSNPNAIYFSEIRGDGARQGSFSWQFEPPAADETLMFDAIERRNGSFATALILPSNNLNARPRGLLIGAFQANGARIWQHRIDLTLQHYDLNRPVGTTLIARDSTGQYVYVAFRPRLDNLARPVRICRFDRLDGTPGPCVDTPFDARVSALIAAPNGQMLLWAKPMQNFAVTGIGLYPLTEAGFGEPLFWSADHVMTGPENTVTYWDTAWSVLEPRVRANPSSLGEGSSTAVAAFSLSVLFANGFE